MATEQIIAWLQSDRASSMAREAVARANSTEIDAPEPTHEQCRQADYVRAYLIRDLKRNGLPAVDREEGGERG